MKPALSLPYKHIVMFDVRKFIIEDCVCMCVCNSFHIYLNYEHPNSRSPMITVQRVFFGIA